LGRVLFRSGVLMLSPPADSTSYISRELLLKLLLPLLGLILGLVLAEVLIRQVRPDIGWRLHRDEYLGWASEEYFAFDPSSQPAPGVQRLLFLGDSFLAGGGMTDLDTRFSVLIADQLENVEVATLASGGWGTDQEYLAYLEKGRAWQPDLVFLCFCPNNDIANILSNSHGIATMMKPYFLLGADGAMQLYSPDGQPRALTDHVAPIKKFRFHSELIDLIRLKLGGIQKRPPPLFDTVDRRYQLFLRDSEPAAEIYALGSHLSWSPQTGVTHVSAYIGESFALNTYQWRLLEQIMQRLQAAITGQGAQLVVVMLPVSYHPQDLRFLVGSDLTHSFQTPAGPFTFRAAEPTERLTDICQRLSVPLFDPTADFQRIVQQNNQVEACWPDPGDRHFSGVGHRIVADLLRDFLREQFPDRFPQ